MNLALVGYRLGVVLSLAAVGFVRLFDRALAERAVDRLIADVRSADHA